MKYLLLALLFSCSQQQIQTPTVAGIATVQTSSSKRVIVTKFSNFNDKYKEQYEQAELKVTEVIASQCFEDFMLDRKLIDTNGKTNKEVVEDIRSQSIEMELISYYKRFSKVVGYTLPNVNKVWVHTKYYYGSTICAKADNLAHETSHKMGYGHSFKPNKQRPYSVPYSINAAFKVCCR